MSKRKIINLDVNAKIKILNAVKRGMSRKDVMNEFKIPKATLCRIIKNGDILEEKFREGHGKHKRTKNAEYPNLENCLVSWMKDCRRNNVPIGGNLLKEKATAFASSLEINRFCVSNGWLDGFKKRHNVVFRKICGEGNAVDINTCNDWIEGLRDIINGYTADNIFNADETGLFYKCLPDKTFTFKNSDCQGGKMSKDRTTILLCANMSGTEKLPLLFIGKPAKPRCLKNIKSLPVEYKNNKKAWMTSSIFQQWLIKIDKEMTSQQRKVLLFIDNCTAHKDLPILRSITVKFLPANTTSKLQPLDQGIIQNFKVFYRKQLTEHMLNCIEEGINYEVNLLHAMRFSRRAWQDVSQITIANCFKKCGFPGVAVDDTLAEIENLENPPNWETLCTDILENAITFEEYINVDEGLPICGALTDEDIILSVSERSDEEDLDCEEIPVDKPIIIKRKVRDVLGILQDYFEMTPGTEQITFNKIQELEHLINCNDKFIQSKITSYF